MAHANENSSLCQQTNRLDGGVLGKKPIKKISHPIGNSSSTYQHRASDGSSFNGVRSKRDSAGEFSSPNNGETVIPHYLRASTGSCHDFCKYGKKHISEEKPWHSFPKSAAKTPSTELCSRENTISVGRNKVKVASHRPPREIKTHAEDLNLPDSKTISKDFSKSIKNEVSLPSKKVQPTPDNLETDKYVQETELKTSNMPLGHDPLLQPKAVLVKISPPFKTSDGKLWNGKINSKIKDGKPPQASNHSLSSDASSLGESWRIRNHSDVKNRKIIAETISFQEEAKRPSDNLPSSMVSTTKIRNLTSRNNTNSKVVSLKDQNPIQTSANVKQAKNERISDKTSGSLEKDTVRNIAKPIKNRGIAASSHKQDKKEEDTIVCYHHDREVEEGEGGRDEATGDLEDAATKQIRTAEDTSKGTRIEGVEGKIKLTLIKGTTTSKDEDSTRMKLNFRSGKVVQLHSDHDAPVRLKFRCGRILLGNKEGVPSVEKICKKEFVIDNKNVADRSSKKVSLRHQDTQDKKNGPGLLNNVIEETASKLMTSKKSKVKALVGAFETLISLQQS